MKIIPKWNFVSGDFDTKDIKMMCIPSDKHGTIELAVKSPDCTCNFPIAKIELYSSERYVDFKETYDDAVKLGNEIARRWNECEVKE